MPASAPSLFDGKATEATGMGCPKCSSDQWKLASLVYREGRASSSSFGIGGGGVDTPGDGALPLGGVGYSEGGSQTELSKRAAPPTKGRAPKPREYKSVPYSREKSLVFYLSSGAAILMMVWLDLGQVRENEAPLTLLVIALVITAVMAGFFAEFERYSASRKDPERENILEQNRQAEISHEARFQQALRRYEVTRMCLRCGIFYVEGDGEVAPNVVVN